MKPQLLIFLLITTFCHFASAKEVAIKCDGTSNTYSTRINKSSSAKETLNFTFDDEKNIFKKIPLLVAQGCYPDSAMIEHKCDCIVSNTLLNCDSSWKSDDGKGKPLINKSTFWINRETGYLQFSGNTDSTSLEEKWTLSYYGNDFVCTTVNKKKF
jgi:hypothetical protein